MVGARESVGTSDESSGAAQRPGVNKSVACMAPGVRYLPVAAAGLCLSAVGGVPAAGKPSRSENAAPSLYSANDAHAPAQSMLLVISPLYVLLQLLLGTLGTCTLCVTGPGQVAQHVRAAAQQSGNIGYSGLMQDSIPLPFVTACMLCGTGQGQ